ncbi:insulinase family protein [Gilvimarinus polysaccharolyticus]|uniref:insulinase family protein n=1 Tax=Gilvimarinus polysaccharolyticus TaxID=863921 RepID=UPI0006731629|nr:insulinase family protein [Gilvimarinus polysaccharolyticus]
MIVRCWLRNAASFTAVLSFIVLGLLPVGVAAAPESTSNFGAVLDASSAAQTATDSARQITQKSSRYRVEEVIASPEDPRRYRALVYDNGMQVLLVNDPAATEADWAFSVLAGANQDPVTLPELNNLLALVLYNDPAADIAVQSEHTEYRLSVPVGQLAGALEHFVEQISRGDDLSDEQIALGQNLLASNIRSGLGATLTDRREDVFSALFNAKHPMARRQGVSASIAQLPVVAKALQDNYNRFYTPARMRLALVANLPLKQQQQLVTNTLSRLSDKAPGNLRKGEYPPLFAPQVLPLMVQIQADIPKPQLQLLFPVPNPLALYAEKPLADVSRLLADGGPGSLLALLKDLGWADAIDTGMGMQSRFDGLYEVRIDLTELGLRAQDQVVALVFYMLDQIRARGLRAWRHDELARAAALNFRYRDATAVRDPAQLVHALHYYAPRDVLYGPYRFNDFNERLTRRYLDFLRSNNVLISLTSKTAVDGEQRSPVLLTPFSVAKSIEQHPDIKIAVRRRLDFPERNNFIPRRLSTKEASMLPSAQKTGIDERVTLFSKPRFQAWFSRAETTSPVASALLRLEVPAAGASARAAVAAELVAELIRQELNENAYAAHLAGVDFSVTAHPLGLDIYTHGYNSQLGLLLTRIAQTVDELKVTERRFNRAKKIVLDRLNAPQNTLDSRLSEHLNGLHYRPSWSRSERAKALPSISFGQLREFEHVHYRVSRLSVLLYGNLYRQEAQRLAALTEHYLLENDSAAPRPATYGLLVAADEPAVAMPTTDDSGLALYLQGQGASAADYAYVQLAAQLLRQSLKQQRLTKPFNTIEDFASQLTVDGVTDDVTDVDAAIPLASDAATDAATTNSPIADSQIETAMHSAGLASDTEAQIESNDAPAMVVSAIQPAQVVVFDWRLAGRPAIVVYYANAETGEPVDAQQLRAFVHQQLARDWSAAELAEARSLVGQRLANNHASGQRQASVALWHELVDAHAPNAAVMAAVADATPASIKKYRQTLAERVANALVLEGQADIDTPEAQSKEQASHWGRLQKQLLNGPVLP